jgi:hypothetical protein
MRYPGRIHIGLVIGRILAGVNIVYFGNLPDLANINGCKGSADPVCTVDDIATSYDQPGSV